MADKFSMTVKLQWSGSDKGKPNNTERNLQRYPQQIPRNLTWKGNRVPAVRDRRLLV